MILHKLIGVQLEEKYGFLNLGIKIINDLLYCSRRVLLSTKNKPANIIFNPISKSWNKTRRESIGPRGFP